jgi:arylsulfatase A-like enzyme
MALQKSGTRRPSCIGRGAPNVLFIVLDTGCGHLGCYGSPIETPNLDRLACAGLRFTNMQTTALCSPSRSCIITGRNHHGNPLGSITAKQELEPDSNRGSPFENGYLSEILLRSGYRTFALGTGHASSELLPLARGFERCFGDDQLTEALVDHALALVAEVKLAPPDRPFFMYFCAGRVDGPQVLKRWVDRYEGRFDDGWDAYRDKVFRRQLEMGLVAPTTKPRTRDADVAEWSSLRDGEKRMHARMMEVFAGWLEHTDHQIGRLLGFLDCTGQLDNTLIMVVSDDTRSAEGRRFRPWIRETHRGAASDPFIVHWPRGISRPGAVRHQYAHVIDMVPTVLEALDIEPPSHLFGVPQSPIQGISFAQAFRSNVHSGKRSQAAPQKRPTNSARNSAVATDVPAPAGM